MHSTVKWSYSFLQAVVRLENIKYGIHKWKHNKGTSVTVYFKDEQDKMFFDLKFGCDLGYYNHVHAARLKNFAGSSVIV